MERSLENDRKRMKYERELRSMAKIYYPTIGFKFRRTPPNNGIYPALEKAAQFLGLTLTEYCRLAIEEKLFNDGYDIDDIENR